MTARVQLRRAAELDLAGIEDWYEAQQSGLGAELLEKRSMNSSNVSVTTPLHIPNGTERTVGRSFGDFPALSGTDCRDPT